MKIRGKPRGATKEVRNMAMTVVNNPSANMTLGELNKNVSKLGKQLSKVASGLKIVSAGDGTADYSISERMQA